MFYKILFALNLIYKLIKHIKEKKNWKHTEVTIALRVGMKTES